MLERLVAGKERLREKHLENWIGGWLRERARVVLDPAPRQRHLLFALCDHFEPRWRRPPHRVAAARVDAWARGYPTLCRAVRDADGRPPRHSFFFPGEEYAPSLVEPLADLTQAGLAEVEVHLHHDHDTEAGLRARLLRHLDELAGHGLLSRDGAGRARYAFIHGNWALANAREGGRQCGVDRELDVLAETGCFADFTFPSAPDSTQPGLVNQIYWAIPGAGRRGYERGERARVGTFHDDRLLFVQGPLCLARRPGRLALRIESGDLTGQDPPTASRVDSWVAQGVSVAGRPDWVFVKVHTHGAQEGIAGALLGEPGHALHQALARYNDGERWRLHYVTAREMYNLAAAAMQGRTGDPNAYRDHILPPPPVAI